MEYLRAVCGSEKRKPRRFRFSPGYKTDHVLQCSEGAKGRAVDSAKEQGEHDNHDKSGRPEGRRMHVLQQRRDKLQVQQTSGDGWRDQVAENQETPGRSA